MLVAPPPRQMHMVDASKDEARLAVRLYNDPTEPRSFEGFVVHMHLAFPTGGGQLRHPPGS